MTLGGGTFLAYAGVAAWVAAEDRDFETATGLKRLATGLQSVALEVLSHPSRAEEYTSDSERLDFTIYDSRARAVVPPDPDRTINPRIRHVLATGFSHEEASSGASPRMLVHRAPVRSPGDEVIGAIEVRRMVRGEARQQTVIYVGAALLLGFLALGTTVYVRRKIERPLRQLLDGIDRVIDGDLRAALPIGRPDEVGQLAVHFNEMTARLTQAQAELRQSEQQLRHSEKLATVGQIAAGIAHEVGTPLGVIAGRARTLARRSGPNDDTLKNALIIAEQSERITGIIQQLLDFSRRNPAPRGATNLNETIRTALSFVEHRIDKARVDLTINTDVHLPPVHANEGEIQQVCLNLVLNALDATPKGGRLFVTTTQDRRRKKGLELAPPIDYAILEVADSGSGIAEEHRDRIFDPFFSTKANGAGTGLGLSVTQGIVKDHDGWIDVADRTGGGTSFKVYLPLEVS